MLFFTINNLSGFLSPAKFVVYSDGRLIYHIEETMPSPFKKVISLTRFRMLLSLELDMVETPSNKILRIKRIVSYPYSYYNIIEGNNPIFSFEPGKTGWKWLKIRSPLRYIIKNGHGQIAGFACFKNPAILGWQRGEVKDLSDQIVATFEWKGFSLWKGYRECELLISRHEEDWVLISIVAAIIKGLYLQQR